MLMKRASLGKQELDSAKPPSTHGRRQCTSPPMSCFHGLETADRPALPSPGPLGSPGVSALQSSASHLQQECSMPGADSLGSVSSKQRNLSQQLPAWPARVMHHQQAVLSKVPPSCFQQQSPPDGDLLETSHPRALPRMRKHATAPPVSCFSHDTAPFQQHPQSASQRCSAESLTAMASACPVDIPQDSPAGPLHRQTTMMAPEALARIGTPWRQAHIDTSAAKEATSPGPGCLSADVDCRMSSPPQAGPNFEVDVAMPAQFLPFSFQPASSHVEVNPCSGLPFRPCSWWFSQSDSSAAATPSASVLTEMQRPQSSLQSDTYSIKEILDACVIDVCRKNELRKPACSSDTATLAIVSDMSDPGRGFHSQQNKHFSAAAASIDFDGDVYLFGDAAPVGSKPPAPTAILPKQQTHQAFSFSVVDTAASPRMPAWPPCII